MPEWRLVLLKCGVNFCLLEIFFGVDILYVMMKPSGALYTQFWVFQVVLRLPWEPFPMMLSSLGQTIPCSEWQCSAALDHWFWDNWDNHEDAWLPLGLFLQYLGRGTLTCWDRTWDLVHARHTFLIPDGAHGTWHLFFNNLWYLL